MNSLTITMAFLMGLTGSLHCAGMCGPIIWVMPFQFLGGVKRWLAILLYHFGRVTTYASLALILHSFRGLFHPQVQQYISMAMGGVLLLIGLLSFFPARVSVLNLPWASSVKKQLGALMGHPATGAYFIMGLLNGLLPCGLVYMALAACFAAPGTIQAVALMYSFGLGTMPMLLALTMLRGRVRVSSFFRAKKLVPAVVFAFGCLFLIRGMNLGIPYLSPGIVVTQRAVKASCCQKNSVNFKIK